MTKQMKFTIGNHVSGYKTVELVIDGKKIFCKILRSGLLDGGKKISVTKKISDAKRNELDELKIFSWEENYSSGKRGSSQWQLTFTDGEKIYRGRGEGAYPSNWENFLDWLDEIFPELAFINRRRLERVTVDYAGEHLVLDRKEKTMTLDKPTSNHVYDAGDDIKKIFDVCQKFFDDLGEKISDTDFNAPSKFELVRHDGTVENFSAPYTENFLPGLSKFIAAVHALANDLSAAVFASKGNDVAPRTGDKLILCKVQFPGSYKHYTYSTDDETLAAGDIVDVPVGRNNDITWARLVDIGYFDEYESPVPLDKIKKIIGKHVADEWENI